MNKFLSDRYSTYEWDDETSQFDPKGVWMGGSEYYARTYRCRVPKGLLKSAEKHGNFDKVHDWIQSHDGDARIWELPAALSPAPSTPTKEK